VHRKHLPTLASALLAGTAFAQTAQTPQSTPPQRPLWELGAVGLGVSQQAYPGSSARVNRAIALPYLIYRGPLLRAEPDGIGVRPVRTPTFEFDVSAAAAFGSRASDDPVRAGMPNIGTLVEAGPRLRWNLGEAAGGRVRADFALRGVFDLSDSLAYRGAVFQPGLQWRRSFGDGWSTSVNGSLLFANDRLASTFYEVAPAYATPARPAYDARSGLMATRLTLLVSKDINRDFNVFGFARIDSVAGAANRSSPLVRQTTGHSVGIGVSWTWLRSKEPAAP
jgi:outer membrane scaffolding protein for murein synthesis (MipA/OmpV family)